MLGLVGARVVARRSQPPEPRGKKKLPPVDLSYDLAIDLWAFSEAHFGAPDARLVREALRFFIDRQLDEDQAARARFDQAKAALRQKTGDNLRVIPPTRPEVRS